MFPINFILNFFYSLIFLFLIILIIYTEIPQTKAATIANSIPVNCKEISKANTKFNQRFLEFMKTWQIPGASIAVMQDNKMLLSCGYGWANLEKRQPMQADFLFRLGSISKTITAITILTLIEQNKLTLDDKVFIILSDLNPLNKSKPNPDIYKITIRNLLQMSSGWYTDRPQDYDPMFGPWSKEMLKQLNYQAPPDCETAARLMMSMPLQFSPGTKFSYSNFNYCLLGLIINKIIKQNGAAGYEIFIKQNLLSPLGINDMQLGSTRIEDKAAKEVTYYAEDKDGKLDGLPYGTTDILRKNYSDGGWISSSRDLAKILQALYNDQILNPTIKKIMLEKPRYTNKKSGYPAMGWDEVNFINGKRYISKIGSFTGTKTFILQSNNGISYAVLFNIKPPHGDQFIKQLREMLGLIKIRIPNQKPTLQSFSN